MPTVSTVPSALVGLVDDAATFPPGNATIADAVAAHARHRTARYADLVGPLVVGDQRVPELIDTLRAEAAPAIDPLAVSVVVSGGAGALEPATVWATRAAELDLRAIEVAVREDAGTPGGLAHNATRLTTALGAVPIEVPAFVELPRPYGGEPAADWLRGLDVLATAGVALKLRTGGDGREAYPSEAELVACIDAALDRELAFKCTAGLHHAVRRTSAEGYEQHGFLNALVATAALLDGAGRAAAAERLAERDPHPLVATVRSWPPGRQPSARRWFRSFGSCSVADPLDDLVRLGLLEDQ